MSEKRGVLAGILGSRKAVAAIAAVVAVVLVNLLKLDPATEQKISETVVYMVTLFIGATAAEDAAHKLGIPPKVKK